VGRAAAPSRPAGPAVPRWADYAVAAAYLALACWVTSGLWREVGAFALVSGGSDVHFFEWALVHATRIFTHGENPLFTPQLNAPNGVNMMANTGLLGLTVPLVPVTLLFGPAVAFTVMLTGGLTATAWAWYYVLSRHIVGFWPAALVGGLFAGFAPGMVNQVNGHPDLVNQFLIPFIVWRAISLRSARDGVVLGLLVTWQAFLNEELLFQTGLALAIFVVVYAMFRPAEVRARVRPSLAGLGAALLTAGVLLGYPLWFQFYGPQSYRGLPETVLGYGTDVRAFAAFSESSLVRHGASHSSYGGPPEENTFFGAPLLIAVGLIVVWLWRRHVAVRALTVVALVFAVLSLGRTVKVGGHTVLQHGPMSLLDHVQLFDSVVPTRFGLALVPVIAILLAFSVHAAATASHAWLRYGWTLVLVAALLPIAPWPVPAERAAPVPGFFTSGQWRQYVDDDQSVFAVNSVFWIGSFTTMDWDNATGQEYRMVGGYFLGPFPGETGNYGPPLRPTAELLINIVQYGASTRITAAQRAAFRADLRYWHAVIVVLSPAAPHYDQLRNVLDQLAGRLPRQVPGALLWDVRSLSG
ncbi:MAG TPA: hypothetical protein VKG61_10970, partial [Streptosporangiaceae bacterium]|nr:hypothetical protein [Streptosporangiaceae bacterium]